MGLQTQWRYRGMEGRHCGLEYTSIRPVCRLLGIKETPDLFACIQVMELTWISELSK